MMPTREVGHDLHRLGADRRRVRAITERLERRGPQVARCLLVVRAVVLHAALLEPLEHEARALDEPSARLVHRHAEAAELDAPEAAADAEDDPTAGEVVEHRDAFGDAHRVVPGQHHDHRAELHVLGAPGHVRQELERVGHHRVAREVVLDRPDRVEPERFGQPGELQLVRVDLVVGPRRRALEDD